MAHASDLIPHNELADIRRRLDDGDLLFKVQMVGARLRQMTEPNLVAVESDRFKKDA